MAGTRPSIPASELLLPGTTSGSIGFSLVNLTKTEHPTKTTKTQTTDRAFREPITE